MYKNIILILCVLSGFCLKAQVNLDSLYIVWQDQTQSDSTRARAYTDYIWDGFLFSQPDTAFILAEELAFYGLDHNYPKAQAAAYILQGVSWLNRNDYSQTLNYYTRALQIYEQIGDQSGIANTLANVGAVYDNQGDYPKALDYYIQCLEINEQIGNQIGNANTLGNIGAIYMKQDDYSKALDYYMQGLEINELVGDQHVTGTLIRAIGTIYLHQSDYPKALDYKTQSLEINKLIGNQIGIANSLQDIGTIYSKQRDYIKALDYYEQSLEINKKMGDQNQIARSLTFIGVLYQNQGAYPKALNYCQSGYELSMSNGSLEIQEAGCSCLYEVYKAMGNSNKTLKYLELLNVIEDSLNDEETSKKLQRMEFQKQIFADSLARKEEVLLAHQIEKELIQSKNRKNQIQYSLVVMVVLFLAALIAVMAKFRINPKLASILIFIFFILVFEFLLVVLDPWVENITDGQVGFKIGINSIMALLIFGIHQLSEKRLKKALIEVVHENKK
jgi:adenylate cyclase